MRILPDRRVSSTAHECNGGEAFFKMGNCWLLRRASSRGDDGRPAVKSRRLSPEPPVDATAIIFRRRLLIVLLSTMYRRNGKVRGSTRCTPKTQPQSRR